MYARCSITHMTVGKVFIARGTQIKSLWYQKPGKNQMYIMKSKQSWQGAQAKAIFLVLCLCFRTSINFIVEMFSIRRGYTWEWKVHRKDRSQVAGLRKF